MNFFHWRTKKSAVGVNLAVMPYSSTTNGTRQRALGRARRMACAAVALLAGARAVAQIALPQVQLPAPLDRVTSTLSAVTDPLSQRTETVTGARLAAARELIRNNPQTVEADPLGAPMRRAEVLVLSPADAVLQRALGAGLELLRRQSLTGVEAEVVVLRSTTGLSTRDALAQLRSLDPEGTYDFNHILVTSGSRATAMASPPPTIRANPPAVNDRFEVGLIDGGVDIYHPVLKGLRIAQAGCNGLVPLTAHGTAVASLLVGQSAGFSGADPGAALLIVDVFCGLPTGGAIDSVAAAIGLLALQQVPVVNISLVGPPNALLAQVIRAAQLRGMMIVAAVGNDGPAAEPLYPAAYPGVIAVTAVDRNSRVLPEACRGPQVQFAAPGNDLIAADARGGLAVVRGTSFAAPVVAGLLAAKYAQPGMDAESALHALQAEARDLGKPGRDVIYGFGLVGESLLHNRKY